MRQCQAPRPAASAAEPAVSSNSAGASRRTGAKPERQQISVPRPPSARAIAGAPLLARPSRASPAAARLQRGLKGAAARAQSIRATSLSCISSGVVS